MSSDSQQPVPDRAEHNAFFPSEFSLGEYVPPQTDFDGTEQVEVPAGTQHGAVFTLRGLGVGHLRREGRGDVHVHAQVVTPTRLDSRQKELLHELGVWLGEGAASLAAVLDPGAIVIGGGVSAAGDLLVQPAQRAFRRQLTGRGHRPWPDVLLASLGNDAGVIGAATIMSDRARGR